MKKYKKAVIHIGSHKSGSTFIQECFFKNACKLLDKGIYYPTSPSITMWSGHHVIPWGLGVSHPLRNPQIDETALEPLLYPKNDSETLLLSSEDFEFLNENGIAKLKSLINSEKVVIVLFLRNVFDYLASDFQQNVRNATTKNSMKLKDYFLYYNFYGRLNYKQIIDRWVNVFGREALNVVNYDKHKFDIIKPIIDAAGIGNFNIIKHTTSNKSLSEISTEVMRKVNKHLPNINDEKRSSLIDKLASFEIAEDAKFSMLDSGLLLAIQRNLSSINQCYAKQVGINDFDYFDSSKYQDRQTIPGDIIFERLVRLL